MHGELKLGDITIALTHKKVKHVHLSVHPPEGHVTLVVPTSTRVEVARAYAISRLAWIRKQQRQFELQEREPERQFLGRESHYIWGRRYLLSVVEQDRKPSVSLGHRRITLSVRPGSDTQKRREVMHAWHKMLLHAAVPPLIEKWQSKLDLQVAAYFLQRMKTKWGSCNHQAGNIRLNTELVKKPKDLLEYVIVHEMLHLIEPSHNRRFVELLHRYYPTWRAARRELNELPLGAELWK